MVIIIIMKPMSYRYNGKNVNFSPVDTGERLRSGISRLHKTSGVGDTRLGAVERKRIADKYNDINDV